MDQLELADLFAIMRELEDAARSPDADRVNALALSMARKAPTGGIANLAMGLVTVTNELRRNRQPAHFDIGLNRVLWRLRLALQEQQSTRESSRGSASPVAP